MLRPYKDGMTYCHPSEAKDLNHWLTEVEASAEILGAAKNAALRMTGINTEDTWRTNKISQ
jgi:hypothetical protein